MIQFVVHCIVFFFFKQKTAYEMRISDWSSDVCSSDLAQVQGAKAALDNAQLDFEYTEIRAPVGGRIDRNFISVGNLVSPDETILTRIVSLDPIYFYFDIRSEEHTSELQSLMRISYAVFCLKKKQHQHIRQQTIHCNSTNKT